MGLSQIHKQGWVCPRVLWDPTCRHMVNRMGKRRSLCEGLGGDHTTHMTCMTFPGEEEPQKWGKEWIYKNKNVEEEVLQIK